MADAGLIAATAALGGSIIGGATSLLTTWLTQRGVARNDRRNREMDKREQLYGRFVDEGSRLYTDSIERQAESIGDLSTLFALVNRMRLVSSTEVIDAAIAVGEVVVRNYREENLTLRRLHEEEAARVKDPMKAFGEAAREELRRLNDGL